MLTNSSSKEIQNLKQPCKNLQGSEKKCIILAIYFEIANILRKKKNVPIIKKIFEIKSTFFRIKSIIRIFYSFL